MDKERLKEIILDQKEVFNRQRNLIVRDIDLDKFISTRQIVVISGIRRCGKSALLFLIKEKMQLSEQDYCYFNFDDERIVADTSILDDTFSLHLEIYGKEPVMFLDEIQNIDNWEKFINRMYEKGLKVFVTGSNAKLLSSEIATSLTGRNKIIELFPFSFAEYLRFIGHTYNPDLLSTTQKAMIRKDFNHYLSIGGFPLVVKENDLELVNSYFQDILYRDIVSRYRLIQVNEIRQIGLYFASNTGKLFSYAALQNFSGVKSLSSINEYLGYYEQSYLFFYLRKFDYSVKKQVMNPKKVYSIDQSFINRLSFSFSENKGRVLENMVYLELRRRGKEVYYFTGKNECDFLVKEGLNITEAIQVSLSIELANWEREIKGLQEAMGTFSLDSGSIITLSVETGKIVIPDNIRVIAPWNWLLSK